MGPRLIVNADDFGLTQGINEAVEELHRAGVLTSATLMATGPAFHHAAALALENPKLGVGCHLIFVDGTPASDPKFIPTLLGPDARTFRRSLSTFALAATQGKLAIAELAMEAQAQIETLQKAGLHVTHVDTHKHVHVFPDVLRAVLLAADRCGVPCLRVPFEPAWATNLLRVTLSRRILMKLLARHRRAFDLLTEDRRARGYLAESTLGIAVTGRLDHLELRKLLTHLQMCGSESAVELCCHPGHVDSALKKQRTRLQESREVEYRALLDVMPEFTAGPGGIRLINYAGLSGS